MIQAEVRLPVRVPMETWAAWRAQLSEYQNRKVDHLERQGHVVVWRVRNVPDPFVEVEGTKGVPSITSLDRPEQPTQQPRTVFDWGYMTVNLGGMSGRSIFRDVWL